MTEIFTGCALLEVEPLDRSARVFYVGDPIPYESAKRVGVQIVDKTPADILSFLGPYFAPNHII